MAITPQKSLPETAGTFSLANQTRHLIDHCHSSGSKKSCGRGRDYDAHAAECAIRQLTDSGLRRAIDLHACIRVLDGAPA